jgi:hypothetical protein
MTDIVRDIMKLRNPEAPDAAEEIERLRAERDRLRLEADGLLDGNLVIWAAYSRLRGALLEIAVMETKGANATVKRMAQKARDALGQGYP